MKAASANPATACASLASSSRLQPLPTSGPTSFDSELAEIFDLQDRVTEQIAGAVEPNLRRAEILRALAKPAENLTAYDLYYRALHLFFQDTKDDLVHGLGLLHRAIDEDPEFALARALAAGLIARGVLVRWLPRDTAHVSECTELAKSALRDGMRRRRGARLGRLGVVLFV